jgi:hypothetical protein
LLRICWKGSFDSIFDFSGDVALAASWFMCRESSSLL